MDLTIVSSSLSLSVEVISLSLLFVYLYDCLFLSWLLFSPSPSYCLFLAFIALLLHILYLTQDAFIPETSDVYQTLYEYEMKKKSCCYSVN